MSACTSAAPGFYRARRKMLARQNPIRRSAIVPVGYPAESPAPKNKWKTENIHYNKW